MQIKRKEAKLKVQEKINLWVNSDKKTLSALKKQEKELLLGVGGKSVHFGEFEGEGKGAVKFGKSVISFEFGKA